MGSLSPDAGYFLARGVEDISHRLIGGLGLGLVLGLVMFYAFYWFFPRVIAFFPAGFREMLRPLWTRPTGSPGIVALSVLVGVATHLILDGFTHAEGWFVLHLPLLQDRIATINGHQVRVCHLLWYAASFAGIAWLVIAFRRWWQVERRGGPAGSAWSEIFAGVFAATLVLPIEFAHHLVRSRLGLIIIALMSLGMVAGGILWITRPRTKQSAKPQAAPVESR
jgi:hypothetical protein